MGELLRYEHRFQDYSITPNGLVLAIGNGISNPTIDFGFVPPRTIYAYRNLTRKSAITDFAIDCRTVEAGAIQHGFKANNSFCIFDHETASYSQPFWALLE